MQSNSRQAELFDISFVYTRNSEKNNNVIRHIERHRYLNSTSLNKSISFAEPNPRTAHLTHFHKLLSDIRVRNVRLTWEKVVVIIIIITRRRSLLTVTKKRTVSILTAH